MKILLTGQNGQVGFELRRALAPVGDVYGVDVQDCDLTNSKAIRQLIERVRPDVIVNPAAYTAVDKAESEQDLAHAINAVAPGVIGLEAAKIGALVVHYSTDYVFDGTKEGRYVETDATNPTSVYGQSKLDGEKALAESGARHLIFRTSWVVGARGHNFARTMLRLAAERDEINVVNDQWGAPTSAALLADLTAHAILGIRDDGCGLGLYHVAAGGETNWYEFARFVISAARRAGRELMVADEAIRPVTTPEYPTPARRPANSRLDTARFRESFGLSLPDWRVGMAHVLEQIV